MRLTIAFTLLFAACAASAQAFDEQKLRAVDAVINAAIADHRIPGGVVWIERGGRAYHRAYGRRALVPADEAMTEVTIFDAASLTKVTATMPSVWLLIQRGKIGLDERVSKYLPEFHGGWRDEVTIRHLLTHTSGLAPDLDLSKPWSGYDTAMQLAFAEMPQHRPGFIFRYSDINFELLGEIVQRVSGMSLDEFAHREVFVPLGMKDTFFVRLPGSHPATLQRIAPTEFDENHNMLRGAVHDPTARRMGGVAGHAGLFTTAADLARYARMYLRGGSPIFQPDTVKLMTSVLTPPNVAVRRAGGFDIDSGFSRPRGDVFPLGSFGHTGFTGTMYWIDPWSQTFYIFLSNRVHPNGKGSVIALQKELGTAAAEAAGVTKRAGLPERAGGEVHPVIGGADVANGIDVLDRNYDAVQHLRLGLITNHTGIDRGGNPTIDLLRSAPGVNLVALFSPEHGIRGLRDENVSDAVDSISGLPLYSLYGDRRAPSPEQLATIDALVFDIQDIGARFYTYISTLEMAMEACAAAHKKFIVLDRVNAIGGVTVGGPLRQGEPSFVAYHDIVVQHGMTVGELAQMFRDEKHLDLDLQVIKLRGWKRAMWQDDAGLPWINTSPNIRSLTAAGLYPGLGLIESAISVGRGTATPFEIVGTPYADASALVRELTALQLPGVRFEAIDFTPTASTFKGEHCHGVRLFITDRAAFRAVDTGIAIATTLRRLYGDRFAVDKMAHLVRNEAVLAAIREGKPLAEIVAIYRPDEEGFRARRGKYLLY